jgi:serine/threonine-protein kinase
MEAQRYSEACAKLSASEQLEPAVGTLLNLGECYERLERLATAWGCYHEATAMAHARGDSDREQFAKSRALALDGRIAKIVIHPRASVPGLLITRDGIAVEPGAWGQALPIDPGTHVIEASAPGKRAWRTDAQVLNPPAATVRIDVPALEDEPSASAAIAVEPPAREGAKNRQASLDVQRGAALVTAGLGVIGVGLGTYFAVRAKSTWNEAKTHCGANDLCDDFGFGRAQDARHQGDVATGAFTVGAAAIAAGVVLWLTAPTKGERTGTRIVPTIAHGGGGAAWLGSF